MPERVVAALLDFLYTGEMREDTADLQDLIDTLQIDPQLISVEEEEEAEDNECAKDKEATAKSECNEREEEEDAKRAAEEDRSDIRAEDNRSSPAADSSDSNGVDFVSASEISATATTDSLKRKLSAREAEVGDADKRSRRECATPKCFSGYVHASTSTVTTQLPSRNRCI